MRASGTVPVTAEGPVAVGRGGRLLRALVALALLAGVLAVAGPRRVGVLLAGTDPRGVLLLVLVYGVVTVLRAARLSLLSRMPPGRSWTVGTAAQATVQVAPARLGELALPALLWKEGGIPLATGAGLTLALRALDMAALGAWVGGAVALTRGLDRPLVLAAAVLLALPLLLLPLLAAGADRLATRLLAPRGQRGRRWTRSLRRMRRTLDGLRARPLRLGAALVLTLLAWGGTWTSAWVILRAMGHSWPFGQVVVGTASATLATLVPVGVLGSFGPMETGWTAGFTALGVPVEVAAASGLAVHLWSLLITVLYGGSALLLLELRRTRSD